MFFLARRKKKRKRKYVFFLFVSPCEFSSPRDLLSFFFFHFTRVGEDGFNGFSLSLSLSSGELICGSRSGGEKPTVLLLLLLGERPRLARQPPGKARPPPSASSSPGSQRGPESPPIRHHHHAPPRAGQSCVEQPPREGGGVQARVEHEDDGGSFSALGFVDCRRPRGFELRELCEARVADDAAEVGVVFVFCRGEGWKEEVAKW